MKDSRWNWFLWGLRKFCRSLDQDPTEKNPDMMKKEIKPALWPDRQKANEGWSLPRQVPPLARYVLDV